MRGTLLTLTGTAAFCFAASTNAAVIFEDNFDSYTVIGDMTANWSAASTASLVSDDNGGNAVLMDGTAPSFDANNTAIHTITELKPTASESIKITGRIFDDGKSNKRSTIGLRNGATPLFEMGRYNSTGVTPWAARAVNFPGANPSWILLADSSPEGWHLLEANITTDSINVTIDFGSDGSIDGSVDVALDETLWAASPGFLELRIGGPSLYSSAGGGLYYDNIKLETVVIPEPASLALLSIGSLAMLRRRK